MSKLVWRGAALTAHSPSKCAARRSAACRASACRALAPAGDGNGQPPLWRRGGPPPPLRGSGAAPVCRSFTARAAASSALPAAPHSTAQLAARPASTLGTAAVSRRSRFDLPVERRQEAPGPRLPTPPSRLDESLGVARAPVRLDAVSGEDVAAQWPPAPLLELPPVARPVRRPHLWLADQSTVGADDAGRFVKVPRDDLLQLLPEGPCGELARDVTLVPSRRRPVGLMVRRFAVEMMMQLSELQDAVDRKGVPRIRKAGFLLDGRKGVGKSQLLNLFVLWARKNGWLVVLEPSPSRYRLDIADIKRSNNGVYIQNEFAQQFLEATSIANRQKFEDIPVDMRIYGSRAIDGETVKETRRLYDPLIEKTVEQECSDQGLSEVERLRRIAGYKRRIRMPSMAEQLRAPVKLWEVVEFGLDHEAYATQAVAELFAQLQWQTTYPVLVVVDEWNECFPCSEYVSIRYDNTRFNGYIPAYHLTMPRALHRWDGHLYRRGLKICATSWMRFKRRDYRPELLNVKDHEVRTVRNFTPHEFANYVTYLRMVNVLHNFPREDLEYFYMMTQGNGYEARKLLTTLY